MKNTVKQSIREKIFQKRINLDPDEKESLDSQIIKTLTRLTEFEAANKILFYASIRNEVDTFELMRKYIGKKTIVLPRTKLKEHTLDLHVVHDLEELEKGHFDILEPPEHLRKADLEKIELAIVPGIAYDPNGHRIGYGKGFYDRVLPNLNCTKIALAYEFQMVDEIPGDPHDHPVDIVLTEERIIETH